MKKKYIFLGLILVCVLSCQKGPKQKKQVIIFHAGSLAVPMKQLKQAFEKKNPSLTVLLEASGSRTAARKVSDLHKPADIVASADYSVIYNLLMPEYADFCINFASNEMSLVYTSKSKYYKEINSNNWPEILLKKGVNYGHSDPNKDPCGYRSQLVWQLAEKFYQKKNLYQDLKKNCPAKNVRPKEVDLLALLETGYLDYIFLYRSVAIQHNLPYVSLPDKINLSQYKFDDFYQTAAVEITGKNPGEVITQKGKAIVYGITLLKKPVNQDGANKFLEFMLSREGLEIFNALGQKAFSVPETAEFHKIPKSLKRIVKKK